MKTIGLIGFGLIGRYIKERLGELGDVKLGFIYDMNPEATASLPPELVISTPEQLVEKMKELSVDLVVEAATYQAVQQLAPLILPYPVHLQKKSLKNWRSTSAVNGEERSIFRMALCLDMMAFLTAGKYWKRYASQQQKNRRIWGAA